MRNAQVTQANGTAERDAAAEMLADAVRFAGAHETETGRLCHSLKLQASADGESVMFVDVDERKVGIQREYRYEITIGNLIALIRSRGEALPEGNPTRSSDAE